MFKFGEYVRLRSLVLKANENPAEKVTILGQFLNMIFKTFSPGPFIIKPTRHIWKATVAKPIEHLTYYVD
jgi:hypothetical protein